MKTHDVGWGFAQKDRVAHYYGNATYYPVSACYRRAGTRGFIDRAAPTTKKCKSCKRHLPPVLR